MKNTKQTFWKYFLKSDGKKLSLLMIISATILLIMELIRDSSDWYYVFIPYFIGLVLSPLGTWMNYKKYWV